jgi:asparagine synthase (glutamine-hydrolysing)
MCGIAGFFGAGSLQLLDAMATAIVHRGPDGGGRVIAGPAGLAMRRLAIIDVEGGQQPMADDSGRLQLVFNGELYNYRELRAAHLQGFRFHTNSDTEVLLHMYEKFGEAAFGMLNGMYAFALWDGDRQCLYLVRDRVGVKPLYYYAGSERLTFASELKALLQDPLVPRRLDADALAAYLTWQYVPGPATAVAGVLKLPPGSFLKLAVGEAPQLTTYWTSRRENVKTSEAAELPDVLRAAVHRQMVSDVPVGAFLSGGLDSSLVVALMRERAGAGLRTFTAGFSDVRLDESAWAAKAARYLGVDHQIVRLDEQALSLLPALAWHLDEPIADRAALPTLVLAQEAARHVKVVLTGEGSDELFGGYPRYRLETWARRFHTLPLSKQRALWGAVASILPGGLRAKVSKLVLSPADAGQRREAWVSNFSREARARLLLAPVLDVPPPAPTDETLASQLLLDMRSWLVDDVLMKVDKTTMAASLEARVPFLDHEVVDWALGLPDHEKLRGSTTKHVVKQAALSVLPPEIIHRPKQGFHPPTATWFRTKSGVALASDILLGPQARGRGLFEVGEVERLLKRHQAGEDADQAVWNLVILELWQQAYIDRVPATSL